MSKRKIKITESELTEHFSAVLFENTSCGCKTKNTLNEEISGSDKSDIKSIVRNEIRDFLKMSRSESLDKMVTGLVKEYIKKDKDVEKHFVDISKNVLVSLYKTLWTRRNFWTSDLKNAPN